MDTVYASTLFEKQVVYGDSQKIPEGWRIPPYNLNYNPDSRLHFCLKTEEYVREPKSAKLGRKNYLFQHMYLLSFRVNKSILTTEVMYGAIKKSLDISLIKHFV